MEARKSTCPECNMQVNSMYFLRHLNRCIKEQKKLAEESKKKPENKIMNKIEKFEIQSPKKMIIKANTKPKKLKKKFPKKKLKKKPKKKKEKQENKNTESVCPKCTYKSNPNDLENHIKECTYKKCNFCKEYFPGIVIDEHKRYHKTFPNNKREYCKDRPVRNQDLNVNEIVVNNSKNNCFE